MKTENQVSKLALNHDHSGADGAADCPPKAYLIAHIEVTDAQRYALYEDIDDDAFTRYGGRFIVRGGTQTLLVGSLKTRTVVIEFQNLQVAMACFDSLENQAAKAVRLSLSKADAVVVEGYIEA